MNAPETGEKVDEHAVDEASEGARNNGGSRARGIRRLAPNVYEYSNEHIVVTWEPMLCEHARECVMGLPAVFNPRARPWIRLSQAEPSEIARVVERCPSLAL